MQKKYTIKLEQLRTDLDDYKKSRFVHSDKLMYDGINDQRSRQVNNRNKKLHQG